MQLAKPSFRDFIKFWFKLGWISFGGPAGQIAIMHEFLVDKKKWISDKKFLHALNYCMLLPGPEAQQLATYLGWLFYGTVGGLIAGIFFILPSIFILLALSFIYVQFGQVPWITAMFEGLKPAVIAIVILALIKIGKKSLTTYFHYTLAAISFIAIFFLHIPFPLIIIGAVLLAISLQYIYPKLLQVGKSENKKTDDESGYLLTTQTEIPHTGFKLSRLLLQISIFFILWCAPLALFYGLSSDQGFWMQLSFFFTKAAFVTFGGAYAVLPYVAQVSVEKFKWLTQLQMVDGLALGETTPGPLIMVLAFVGFMAGYGNFNNSLIGGTLGLLVTTYYTFLPCFLFIFAGAPIIEKTQNNPRIKSMLTIVTAVVVGVVLNLAVYFGEAVLFQGEFALSHLQYLNLSWVIISFVAMYRFKVPMIPWIGISAVFGLVCYFLGWA